MRIGIIGSRGVPALWGGFETVASEIAPRLVERGHDVTVYCRPRYSLPSRPSVSPAWAICSYQLATFSLH